METKMFINPTVKQIIAVKVPEGWMVLKEQNGWRFMIASPDGEAGVFKGAEMYTALMREKKSLKEFFAEAF